MYQGKTAGRNTLRFFDPEMQANITVRVALTVNVSARQFRQADFVEQKSNATF